MAIVNPLRHLVSRMSLYFAEDLDSYRSWYRFFLVFICRLGFIHTEDTSIATYPSLFPAVCRDYQRTPQLLHAFSLNSTQLVVNRR